MPNYRISCSSTYRSVGLYYAVSVVFDTKASDNERLSIGRHCVIVNVDAATVAS
jgi:hypothetical protein